MPRFVIQESERPGHYVVTDTVNGYVVVFEKGRFNGTQKIAPLNDEDPNGFMAIARTMRELGDWLMEHHRDKV